MAGDLLAIVCLVIIPIDAVMLRYQTIVGCHIAIAHRWEMTLNLKGRSVVITGGTTGIGFEIVRECLRQGVSNVAMLDLNDNNDAVETLSKQFRSQKVIFVQTDVASAENVRRSFGVAVQTFGCVDIVFGNAGILNESQPDRMIEVNLLGIVHSTNAAIDCMSNTNGFRGGTVVNISSTAGLDTMYSIPAYTASKHGVLAFTKCMGDKFYHRLHGIRFICVCPGMTNTGLLGDATTHSRDGGAEMDALAAILPTQSTAALAKCVLEILHQQKNGSVWLVDGGKAREVVLPNYYKP